VRSLFRDTESDLVSLFRELADDPPKRENVPLIMKFAIRGTPDDIAGLRRKLEEWLEECENVSAEEGEDSSSYSGLLAFYPRPDNA
jgi:hypothetical protein